MPEESLVSLIATLGQHRHSMLCDIEIMLIVLTSVAVLRLAFKSLKLLGLARAFDGIYHMAWLT